MIFDALRRLWFYFFDRIILYPLLSWIIPKFGITFLNLGYWPQNYGEDRKIIDVLRDSTENGDSDRPHYYLYEKPLSYHPSYPNLADLKLLEVACGQGSGLKWLQRAHPKLVSLTGLDRIPSSSKNIISGNAENLPLPDSSFDIILNVEASHLFGDCYQFLKECHRVLKPGGYLCWADLRYSEQISSTRTEARAANLIETSFVDITENVLAGIERTSSKYDKMLAKAPYVVKLFSSSLRATYCAPGTHTYNRFAKREKLYFAATWKKADK